MASRISILGRTCAVLFVAVLQLSCDSSDEETGPYDCANGAVRAGAQCFEFQGVQQAFRFDVPGVAGFWSSDDYETCIAYSDDGTGTFHYWGIFGGVPRDDSSVLWGVWVDVDGDPIASVDGLPIVVHRRETGPELDRRLIGLNYTEAAGFGGILESLATCPDNVESMQGAISFFTTNTDTDEISIGLDSFVVGELTTKITGDEPECGEETSGRILTVYRQPGTYRFQALSSVATWGPTDIVVEKGSCTSHNLQ